MICCLQAQQCKNFHQTLPSPVDVRLVCQGGLVEAHKFILSACVPALADAMATSDTIFMFGVELPDIISVIDFVYRGTVEVAEDRLDKVIALAIELQVLQPGEEGVGKKKRKAKRKRDEAKPNEVKKDEVKPSEVKKDEVKPSEAEEAEEKEESELVIKEVKNDGQDIDTEAGKLVIKEDDKYRCTQCDKIFPSNVTALRHTEIHLGIIHSCSLCETTCRTRNAMAVHYSSRHDKSVNFRKLPPSREA